MELGHQQILTGSSNRNLCQVLVLSWVKWEVGEVLQLRLKKEAQVKHKLKSKKNKRLKKKLILMLSFQGSKQHRRSSLSKKSGSYLVLV